jgi:hypothetical protein
MYRKLTAISIALVAGTLVGCSDSGAPGIAGRQAAFSLATKPGTPAPTMGTASALAGSETFTDPAGNTLVISQVQAVLKKIEFSRVGVSVSCDNTTHADDCEELEAGPILLDLPLGAGAARQFTVPIDTGTYSKVEFKIHKPSATSDAAFVAANPTFDGVSIMVTGTYNGTPFTYTTDLDVSQEADLVPPITVTDQAGANLTVFVDLSQWYLNGTTLVDPATANPGQANEGLVKNNIESSFHAFEDDNHDGKDDHGGA